MTTTSTFVETQFPPDISYGSSGGSGFSTTVFTTEGGWEQRNINWSMTRAEYDVSQGIKSRSDMDVLVQFFMAMKGKAYAFRFGFVESFPGFSVKSPLQSGQQNA